MVLRRRAVCAWGRRRTAETGGEPCDTRSSPAQLPPRIGAAPCRCSGGRDGRPRRRPDRRVGPAGRSPRSVCRRGTSRGPRRRATSSCSTTIHGSRRSTRAPGNFGFVNSDLAFTGDHAIVGSFNGFQVYDISDAGRPRPALVVRVPRRAGRRLGLRRPAVHVGRGDARPDRLRHSGRTRCGEPASASVASASSTSATSPTRCSCPACRRAAARTPIRSSPTPTTRPTSTSTTPAPPACARPLELAGCENAPLTHRPGDDGEPDAVADRRHQGAARRPGDGGDRQPAADLHRSGHRRVQRPAEHAARRRAASVGHGRTHRRRTPTRATTSRPTRRSASPPARARATASCSTSPTR